MLKTLVLKNRSYRRFEESYSISRETLLELVVIEEVGKNNNINSGD